MYLQGRIGLHEALEQFKADLFMSSLTESSEWRVGYRELR
jgi:hypothetical protein